MKYVGSKNRIAKYILPIMLAERGDKPWVEPFVGGGNIIDKVKGERYGYDINIDAINALITIRDSIDSIAKNDTEFTEQDYKLTNDSFAGFAYSYGAKWRGGWRRDKAGKRDYIAEAYRNALKQHPLLQGVHLECRSYDSLIFSKPSLIYCDPPYAGTTKYSTGSFSHDHFWQWCRDQKNLGHTIFISEYSAPSDFKCLWEKEIVSSLTKNTGSKKGVERLFTI